MNVFSCIVLSLFLSGCIIPCCVNPVRLEPTTLSKDGDCTTIESYNDKICLFIEDMSEGWVRSQIVVTSTQQVVVEAQTYLSSAWVEFSPNKKMFMLEVTSEGHPSYGFYATQRAINTNEQLTADYYLEEYNFEHIEYIRDNGDVVFALSEVNGSSCYAKDRFAKEQQNYRIHKQNCLTGFNIYSKKIISIEQATFCSNE